MKIITKELIRNCVFGVKCNKKWKSMKHVGTDSNDRDIRFCSGCEKEVFETKTPEELYNNIELNRCVAMIHEEHTTVGHVTDIDWDDSKSIS